MKFMPVVGKSVKEHNELLKEIYGISEADTRLVLEHSIVMRRNGISQAFWFEV